MKTCFLGAGGKLNNQLNEGEFVEAVGSSVARYQTFNLQEKTNFVRDVRTLFRKVEATTQDSRTYDNVSNFLQSCRVTWQDFTNFILWHLPSLDKDKACIDIISVKTRLLPAGPDQHTDMITSLLVLDDTLTNKIARADGPKDSKRTSSTCSSSSSGSSCIVTAGRDGVLKLWASNCSKLIKTVDVGSSSTSNCNSSKNKKSGNWVTAVTFVRRSKRLAVASSDFLVHFYQFSSGNSGWSLSDRPVATIDHPFSTILCLGYAETSLLSSRNGETLLAGDNKGSVTLYQLEEGWTAELTTNNLSSRRPHLSATASTLSSTADSSHSVSGGASKRASRMVTSGVRLHTYKLHGAENTTGDVRSWVTQVSYIAELQTSLVSAGLDGAINLCEISCGKMVARETVSIHGGKGVHAFCWCPGYKFFASAGWKKCFQFCHSDYK